MRRTISYIFYMIVLCAGLLLCHCKKDEGPVPRITVLSPADLSSYNVGDSIPCVASITHTKELESIKVSLLNADNIPVLPTKFIYPSGNTYELDYMYPISKDLESGQYSLLISAGDGKLTANTYTTVMITSLVRYFEKAIVICRNNLSKSSLYAIDENGDYENMLTLLSGYTDSDISSGLRQLYFLRPNPYRLIAFDLDSLSEEYVVDAPPPSPIFNSVHFDQGLAYVTNHNGEIRGYDQFGNTKLVTGLDLDTIPENCWIHENLILAYCERLGSPERYMKQFYKGTGVFRMALKIDLSVVEVFSLDAENAFLVGNDNNIARAYIYNVVDNVLYQEMSFPQGVVRSAAQISEEIILIGHEDGIYLYDHSSNSLSPWLSGIEAEVMAFDDQRQLVYISSGEKVYAYSYPGSKLLHETTLPFGVLNILVQYNK